MAFDRDFAWKVVNRYDAYLGGINAKAATICAFNAFYIGSIALKWETLISPFPSESRYTNSVEILLVLGTVGAVFSLYRAINSVIPYLQSFKSPGNYHSLVFFEHVADFSTPDAYMKALEAATDAERERDIALQAHALAGGLRSKYLDIRTSYKALLLGPVTTTALIIVVGAIYVWNR